MRLLSSNIAFQTAERALPPPMITRCMTFGRTGVFSDLRRKLSAKPICVVYGMFGLERISEFSFKFRSLIDLDSLSVSSPRNIWDQTGPRMDARDSLNSRAGLAGNLMFVERQGCRATGPDRNRRKCRPDSGDGHHAAAA